MILTLLLYHKFIRNGAQICPVRVYHILFIVELRFLVEKKRAHFYFHFLVVVYRIKIEKPIWFSLCILA